MTLALTLHADISMRGMHWPNNCTETDYKCAIRRTGSAMEFILQRMGWETNCVHTSLFCGMFTDNLCLIESNL